MLTGKTKYLFYKYIDDLEFFKETNYFFQFPFTMQYGVYLDFFDSQGLNILLTCEFDFGYIITENRYDEIEEVIKYYDTRKEAIEQAILKANEILNSDLK